MSKKLTIQTQRTSTLNNDVRSAVDHVCKAARPDEVFDTLFQFLPPDGLHIMGYIDDLMVSHAVVTTRWLQPEGLPTLKCAYIDAVSTLPTEEGKGYGSTVMKHLTTVIPDYQIGALQTERVSFYQRVGWEVWPGPLAGRKDDGSLVPTPDMGADRIMIYRLPETPALNMDSLLTIKYQGRMW